MDRSTLFAVPLLVLLCNVSLAVAFDRIRINGHDEFMTCVAANESAPIKWAAFIRGNSLGRGPTGLHFEVSTAADDSLANRASGTRTLLEFDGKNEAKVVIGMHGLPVASQINYHTFIIDSDGRCKFRGAVDWGFTLDAGYASKLHERIESSENHITCRLGAYIGSRFSNTRTSSRWHRQTRTLEVFAVDGSRATVSVRTPSDSLRYGSPFSMIMYQSDSEVSPLETIWISGFQTKLGLLTRLRLPDARQLGQELAGETFEPNLVPKIDVSIQSNSKLLKCVELYEKLYKCVVARTVTTKDIRNKSLEPLSELEALTLADRCAVVRAMYKDGRDRKIVADFLLATLMMMEDSLGDRLASRYIFPDDPYMVRKEYVDLVGPINVSMVIAIGESIVSNDSVPMPIRLLICSYLSDCGVPMTPVRFSRMHRLGSQSEVADLIMKAGWRLPTSSPQTAKIVRDIAPSVVANNASRGALIKALLIIGEAELVPQDYLDEWIRINISRAPSGIRWRSICLLSSTVYGRTVLEQHLESGVDYKPLEREMLKALALRASATRETGRYDFMSLSDCEEILALTNRGVSFNLDRN